VRIALVALAVLAIVLPTALIPETASAHGNVYSVRQVLRAFRDEGIPLYRQAGDQPNPTSESFAGPKRLHLDVTVSQPVQSTTSVGIVIVTTGNEFPRFANRGNVGADWTTSRAERGEGARIHAALRRLRYSAVDAARPALPTIGLRPGERRLIHVTGAGTEVDCDNGASQNGQVLGPSTRSSSTSVYSGNDVVASLSWRALQNSVFALSCSGLAPVPPVSELDVPKSSLPCRAGPRRVRAAGLSAFVPRGWWAAASRQVLWIANDRTCDSGRTPGPTGVSVALRFEMHVPEKWPGRPAFRIRTDPSSVRYVHHGFDIDSIAFGHRFYSLNALFGPGARSATGIRLADSVLGGVKPVPR